MNLYIIAKWAFSLWTGAIANRSLCKAHCCHSQVAWSQFSAPRGSVHLCTNLWKGVALWPILFCAILISEEIHPSSRSKYFS